MTLDELKAALFDRRVEWRRLGKPARITLDLLDWGDVYRCLTIRPDTEFRTEKSVVSLAAQDIDTDNIWYVLKVEDSAASPRYYRVNGYRDLIDGMIWDGHPYEVEHTTENTTTYVRIDQ